MNLVCTAITSTWEPSDNILLGEWCRLYNDRDRSEKLDAKILPYPWDKRELIPLAYHDLLPLYETILLELGTELNSIHRVQHSPRYWRISIGPWLLLFMESLLERFTCLIASKEHGFITRTKLIPPQTLPPPRDTSELRELLSGDLYNLHLYSRVIDELSLYQVSYSSVATSMLPPAPRRSYKRKVKNIAAQLGRFIPALLHQVVFVSSYFKRSDLLKLQLALGQVPYLIGPELEISDYAPDPKYRSQIALKVTDCSDFERLVRGLITSELPCSFLEGYSELVELARASYPRNPRVIVTANAHLASDVAQAWMGEAIEQGAKLAIIQHGGHYGTGLWSSTDDHEIAIADRFYSWGWDSNLTPRVKPLDAPKLIGISSTLRPSASGGLLLVSNSLPRYSYRMYSIPVAGQFLRYLNQVSDFCELLDDHIKPELTVRLHPQDLGWNDRARMLKRNPELNIYRGGEPLHSQLNRSRLVVGTHNATTYLESLAANYPTIIFWNPDLYELSESALPYFEELRAAGIFFHSPEEAAAKVNQVFAEPSAWWNKYEVQRARKRFIDRFACSTPDWLGNWRNELRALKAERS